jgi:unsaturated rhamnogalacturonyl hydrolase
VNAEGKLTHVQPVGYTPVTFDPESSEPFGVGAFLLAGSEVRRLP